MIPTLIFLIIVVTIINVIMVNNFITWIYDEFGGYADPEVARAFMRLCLVPPIGIAVVALSLVCITIAWIIMMILDVWDRQFVASSLHCASHALPIETLTHNAEPHVQRHRKQCFIRLTKYGDHVVHVVIDPGILHAAQDIHDNV